MEKIQYVQPESCCDYARFALDIPFDYGFKHFELAFSGSRTPLEDQVDGVGEKALGEMVQLSGCERAMHFIIGFLEWIPILGIIVAIADHCFNAGGGVPPIEEEEEKAKEADPLKGKDKPKDKEKVDAPIDPEMELGLSDFAPMIPAPKKDEYMGHVRWGSTDVYLVQGSVVDQDTDAIVNAANERLLGGGGVDGAIHSAAGGEVLAQCKKIKNEFLKRGDPRTGDEVGTLKVGEAVITKAGKLPSKRIIHTVGPQDRSAEALKRCYDNCMLVAKQHHVRSISLCCISVGIFGFPLKKATTIAIDTVKAFCEMDSSIASVRFVVYVPPAPKRAESEEDKKDRTKELDAYTAEFAKHQMKF